MATDVELRPTLPLWLSKSVCLAPFAILQFTKPATSYRGQLPYFTDQLLPDSCLLGLFVTQLSAKVQS